MLFHPTKTRIRLCLIAAGLWLSAAPAFGQDAKSVTLKLSIAEAVELQRLIDLQPISQAPPPAFWDLQLQIDRARADLSARERAR